jgi:rhodanese-related sulfurtransferase
MRKAYLSVAAAIAVLAVPAVALACEGHEDKHLTRVTLEQAKELHQAKKAVFVDANGAETRKKMGVIPNATLLSSVGEYVPAKELPSTKDQQLVFYCANTKCTAAEQAAKKAVKAGYTHVNVLPDGIKGWKESGAQVQVPQS